MTDWIGVDVESLPDEEWRDVVGYEGYYRVSSLGRVQSVERLVPRAGTRAMRIRAKILHPTPDFAGYLTLNLCRHGKRDQQRVHRLVAVAFLGGPHLGLEVCHGDGDPAHNAVGNLRWDTHVENMADKSLHGTRAPKATSRVRAEILQDQEASVPVTRTAERLGLSPSTVYAVRADGRKVAA